MNFNLVPQEKLDSLSEQLGQIRKLLESLFPQNDHGELMTNKEAANYLKVTSRTLQKYRDTGQIAFSQIGRKIFYKKTDLDTFVFDINRVDFHYKKGGSYEF